MGKYLKWTEEEFFYLKENYSKLKREEISNFLNRKWGAIAKKASILGLCRACSNSHFYKLLEESNITYYWMGFLFADGHFSKYNEFAINLQQSDIEHLTKFSNYVSVPVKRVKNRPYISVRIMDKIIVKQIKDKFKIHNNKTENVVLYQRLKDFSLDCRNAIMVIFLWNVQHFHFAICHTQ